MTIQDVKKDICSYNIQNFYIFTGNELEIRKLYYKELAKRRNLTIKHVERVEDIITSLQHKSLFLEHFCYVVQDDDSFKTSQKLWEIEKYLEDDMLILLYGNIDKRTSFYTAYADRIVVFDYLSEPLLIDYIQRRTNLSEVNSKKLINLCESDYSRILLEIDKISHYLDSIDPLGDDLDWNYGLDELIKYGTIHTPPQDAIFDLCSSILARDIKSSFECLEHCKRIGESPLAILSVLFTNTVQVLQIQTCESDNIGNSTGLNTYQIRHMEKFVNKRSVKQLEKILRLVQKLESLFKIGKVDEEFILDYLMVNIL